MILESIVTTKNADGTTRIAPMGPVCDEADPDCFELRPFPESTTFANLQRTGEGIVHVTDDVLLFARSAIGQEVGEELFRAATHVDGQILENACRAWEFRVLHSDLSGVRASLQCRVVARHRLRDFFGFNRARHMILEAAILATRVSFIPEGALQSALAGSEAVVRKTGSGPELRAWELLSAFARQRGDFQRVDSGSDNSSPETSR